MEGAAEGPAAEEHGAGLPGTLELDGTLERIHHALYVAVREQEGREAGPSSKGGAWLDPSGYDAGKKVKGRKRHILVDTLGLLLNVVVHSADVQDRVMEPSIYYVERADCSLLSNVSLPTGALPGRRWRSSSGARAPGSWKL